MSLRGKVELGNYQNHKLVIDWNDLWFFRGGMGKTMETQRLLGQLLKVVGGIMAGGGVVWLLLIGQLQLSSLLVTNSLPALTFWLGVSLFIYGLYCARTWEELAINGEQHSLHQLQRTLSRSIKPQEVEIDSYISVPTWLLLDYAYHRDNNFLNNFAQVLGKDPQVQILYRRLGLTAAQIDTLITSLHNYDNRLEYNTNLLVAAFHQAMDLGSDHIDTRTFVIVMLLTVWKQPLLSCGVTAQDVAAVRMWLRNEMQKQRYEQLWEVKSLLKPRGTVNRAFTSRAAPTLQEYGMDYTRQMANKGFVLSIGKEDQLRELIKILQKEQNAAALVVGDAGVGKTYFLYHLATRMVVEDVPGRLTDKRLVAFDFNRAFTESQKFEDFKIILQDVFAESAASGDIVLVLDNLDQLLNVRDNLRAEIVTLLVNGIDQQGVQVVGTVTGDGFNRFVKQVPALVAAFQTVMLNEPAPEIALQILIDAAPRLEQKYAVGIEMGALRQIVALAPQFAHERVMPDKGIDLLEESLIEARDLGLQHLDAETVSKLVSRKVGVTVGSLTKDESETLINLEQKMHARVTGQEQAITAVANALRRTRAGLQQKGKPIASFLFFGPTGVGKTEVARTLAATYYGDEKLMVRIDMSEYQEAENLARLIGRMDGQQFVGGYLTEAIRQRPFSLVLFDEIEKANPKVLDLFLQLLDEGRITDGAGRKVDFTNTIIIATSNAASAQIAELVGQGVKYDQVYKQVFPELRKVFRVEFLNRFTKVVMFKTLSPIEVGEIATRMLEGLAKSLADRGYRVEFGSGVVQQLVEAGYDPVYGARELQRIIQEKIEDRVAAAVVKGELQMGGHLLLDNL